MGAVDVSETRYATTADGVDLAYRVVGGGPRDVLWCFNQLSDVEVIWDYPPIADFLHELAASWRLIVHDRRGMGRSGGERGDLDTDVSDLLVVLDAIGAGRAHLIGAVGGGAIYSAFAKHHADRVAGVAWHGAFARYAVSPDYPWGGTPEQLAEYADATEAGWGTREFAARFVASAAPSMAEDDETARFFERWMRATSDAPAAAAWLRYWSTIDLRPLLAEVEVPTLITIRGEDPAESAHVASLMPNAKLVVLDGEDFMPFYERGPVVAAFRDFMDANV